LQISAKLTNPVFLVPIRMSSGGFMTMRLELSSSTFGFLSRITSNARRSSCTQHSKHATTHINHAENASSTGWLHSLWAIGLLDASKAERMQNPRTIIRTCEWWGGEEGGGIWEGMSRGVGPVQQRINFSKSLLQKGNHF